MRLSANRSRVLLLGFLSAAAALCLLLLSGWFIAASALAGLAASSVMFNYVIPAAAIRLLAFTRIVSSYGSNYFAHASLLQRANQLRESVYTRVMDSAKTSPRVDDMEALEQHTDALANEEIGYLVPSLTSALLSVILVLGCGFLFPAWTPVLLGVLAVFLLIYIAHQRRCRRLHTAQSQANAAYRRQIEHSLSGASLWNLADRSAAFFQAQTRWIALRKADQARDHWSDWQLQVLALSAVLVSLWLIPASLLGSPLIILLPLAMLTLPEWLGAALRAQKPAAEARAARRAISELGSSQPVAETSAESERQRVDTLELSEFSWCREQRCGEPLSLRLKRGELVGLQGDSGCGKTSLLLAMAGLLPQRGQLRANGKRLYQPGSAIHYAEQHPSVLSDTLRNNLLIARPSASEGELLLALELAQLSHLHSHLDKWLGPRGRSLSGGERKRLGLARAWLADRDVWLLDEPFEGLDAHTQTSLADAINSIAENRIVIVVSHQSIAALNCKRVITLGDNTFLSHQTSAIS